MEEVTANDLHRECALSGNEGLRRVAISVLQANSAFLDKVGNIFADSWPVDKLGGVPAWLSVCNFFMISLRREVGITRRSAL